MEKLSNTPSIRFPEFTREWEVIKIGDIFPQIVVGFVGTVSDSYCDKEIGIPFIRTLNVKDGYFSLENIQYVTREFHNSNEKSKIYNGDILLARVGANMGQVCKVEGLTTEANSANVIIIKQDVNNSSNFYAKYLSSDFGQRQINARGAGGAQEVLNISVTKTIIVPHPMLVEQAKIASFLSAVDEKIQALKKKKSLLENYKKGVRQKLFSQELRFKDENRNEFPEWSPKRIGDCLDYEQPTNYLVTNTEYSDKHSTPVVTAGKTFVLGYTDENWGIFSNGLPVIIFDDFTTATQFVDFPFKAKSSAMKILKAKENTDIKFMYEALQMINYETGAHGRNWISVFAGMEIPIPIHREQIKISKFLTELDKKINSVNFLLVKTENWKKGLLQKMFC